MTDIASSLEHEFADRSQAARELKIAELKKIAAAGSGSVDIVPRGIIMPVVAGLIGLLLVVVLIRDPSAIDSQSGRYIAFLIGAALLAYSAWALFYPRKPRFTLTEEGVRVKKNVLLWSCIEDYTVALNTMNGFPVMTLVTLKHPVDYTPVFGGTLRKDWLRSQPTTHLGIMFGGAKGMNTDTLAKRIGEFRAAFHAREELARLQAN